MQKLHFKYQVISYTFWAKIVKKICAPKLTAFQLFDNLFISHDFENLAKLNQSLNDRLTALVCTL